MTRSRREPCICAWTTGYNDGPCDLCGDTGYVMVPVVEYSMVCRQVRAHRARTCHMCSTIICPGDTYLYYTYTSCNAEEETLSAHVVCAVELSQFNTSQGLDGKTPPARDVLAKLVDSGELSDKWKEWYLEGVEERDNQCKISWRLQCTT